MRRVNLWAITALLAVSPPVFAAHHAGDFSPEGPAFSVGGLVFTIPEKWVSEPASNPVRVGQWRIPAPRGQTEGGEAVAFYFGPGIGGTARENIDAWAADIANADGHPVAADAKSRMAAGLKISEFTGFGVYRETVPVPGIPPLLKPNYGLVGVVVENAQGNIYWRFTGPEPLITADLPLFNKIIDGVRPQGPPSK
jgi:hypothetical protein